MRKELWNFSFFCLFLVVVVGCGKPNDVVPVAGKVTFNGKPVPNASVTFYPSEQGQPSMGVTKDDGTFELTVTGGQGLVGAKIGVHKVTVSAIEELGQKTQSADSNLGSIVMDMQAPAKTKSLLPVEYSSIRTTDLTYEVKAGEENVADFAL